MDLNKKWMSNAKNIGCTFAALFANNPKSIGWVTVVNPQKMIIPKDAFIISIQFPNKDKEYVKNWALENGFYIEDIDKRNKGLRYKIDDKSISWVQYFGPDSHVLTRQAPIPELCLCVKLPSHYYLNVGFKGILHLAHASIEGMKISKVHKLWETSFKRTRKSLGYSPTVKEAAKTTYYE